MMFLREIIGGLIAAAILIAYHSAFPAVRVSYTDARIMCDLQVQEPPPPWQSGGI